MKGSGNIRYYYYSIGLCFVLLYLVVLASNVPSPIRLRTENQLLAVNLFPQGWSFFTRNPLEEKLFLYDTDFNLIPQNVSGKNNWYGLKRNIQSEGLEVALLFAKVPDSVWTEVSYRRCEKPNLSGVSFQKIVNDVSDGKLVGNYYFEIKSIIPYEWREDQCLDIHSRICSVTILRN